jgi:transmembrane sensor
MKEPLSKDLLFDFFDGRTTSMQRKLVEDWLAEPDNEEFYYHCLNEWESHHPQFTPAVDNAFARYQALMNSEGTISQSPVNTELRTRPLYLRASLWGAVAACLVLASGFIFQNQLLYQSLSSANGQIASYQLSDGTRVVLNANSVLRIPRFGFGDGTRKVILEGEAEFKVIHTEENSRFVVAMDNDYSIEVLGTEFVAFSRERGTKVFLTKGKVKLSLPRGKQLYMKPGNLFIAGRNGQFSVTPSVAAEQFTAFKREMFYFDNTLLSEVVQQMNDRFKVNVRISDPVLARHRIGGVYKARQADDLLEILSELLHLEVVKHEEYIELRKSDNHLNP